MLDSKAELISEMQEELFLKQGQGWFRIVSGSMQPLIDVHDRVLAKRVPILLTFSPAISFFSKTLRL